MTTTKDIADGFTALCKAGKFDEAGEAYWAANVVSLEATPGDMARAEGIDAVRGKGEWWANAHEIHSASTEGPFVNDDQFAVIFRMDVTQKESGQRIQLDEVATYTVKDGKIVEERFYY